MVPRLSDLDPAHPGRPLPDDGQALLSRPEPQDRRGPIGVFDSGVGGLTVLHECLVSLPEEDFLYLGDDGRFPYGVRAPAELAACSRELTSLLLGRGAKLIVIACNSAASAGIDAAREVASGAGVEVVAVIEPEAEIASAITDNGNVGVLATPATVEGGAYRRALERQGSALEVTEVACPDLAPIIQRGFPFSQAVVETVRSYCRPLQEAEVDTVILGCTHYPLVAPMLQRILGRNVRLVTAGHAVAAAVQRLLDARDLATDRTGEGEYRFLCTGDPGSFRELGTRFLQMPLGDVELVSPAGWARVPSADVSSILERVQEDVKTAMKAGERERVGALRLIANALSAEHKEGTGDEVAALRRERKKRLDAAEAYEGAGRAEAAAGERTEAGLIEEYLPAEMDDSELAALVDEAIAETGAGGPQDMGKVMGAVMPRVDGRADGARVSAAVKERLAS